VLAIVTVGGVVAVAHSGLSVGAFVAFVTLFLRLLWPLIALGWLIAVTQEAGSAAHRIFEVMDLEADIVDPADPVKLPAVPFSELRFEHVSAPYPGSDTPILTDVNLDIRPGETMALVGATGAGKTTLTALVPRLYDVTSGRITIDGVDVRDVRLSDLRSQVAMAFEDATLFSASVRENLTLGRENTDEADVLEAIEIAQADFVFELPHGLDTRIGEQGMSLSGGHDSGWRWRAPCSAGHASSCWTTRCPPSTSRRRRWSRTRCAGCSPARPR
jgi:ABC-type multidrug transport system, ATPase and permease components